MALIDEQYIDYELRSRLDQLFREGHCFIKWSELYHWFNSMRLSKVVWRKIQSSWEEVCARRGYELAIPVEIRGIKNDNGGGITMIRSFDEFIDVSVTKFDELV